jgi:hypothetical protein
MNPLQLPPFRKTARDAAPVGERRTAASTVAAAGGAHATYRKKSGTALELVLVSGVVGPLGGPPGTRPGGRQR